MTEKDKLFDIFCQDFLRRELEKQNNLRMRDDDYSFYEDQKGQRKQKCLDVVEPPNSSDIIISQRHIQHSSKETPAGNSNSFLASTSSFHHYSPFLSETESVQPDTTNEYESSTRSEESQQNRKLWPSLARMCERYQVSDRAGAAIANSALQDAGVITRSQISFVIDKNKIKKTKKHRQEIRTEKDEFFELVNSVNVDGRQDATLVLSSKKGKTYIKNVFEEHYVIVWEPEDFYLDHFSPPNGKGQILASHMHNAIEDTELEQKLVFVGSDGTSFKTGHTNGLIASSEDC